jgi:hypothetical protein
MVLHGNLSFALGLLPISVNYNSIQNLLLIVLSSIIRISEIVKTLSMLNNNENNNETSHYLLSFEQYSILYSLVMQINQSVIRNILHSWKSVSFHLSNSYVITHNSQVSSQTITPTSMETAQNTCILSCCLKEIFSDLCESFSIHNNKLQEKVNNYQTNNNSNNNSQMIDNKSKKCLNDILTLFLSHMFYYEFIQNYSQNSINQPIIQPNLKISSKIHSVLQVSHSISLFTEFFSFNVKSDCFNQMNRIQCCFDALTYVNTQIHTENEKTNNISANTNIHYFASVHTILGNFNVIQNGFLMFVL